MYHFLLPKMEYHNTVKVKTIESLNYFYKIVLYLLSINKDFSENTELSTQQLIKTNYA